MAAWNRLGWQLSEWKLLGLEINASLNSEDKVGCSENVSNRMVLVFRVMVEEQELQDRLPSGLLVNTCLHPCITLSVWIWLDQGLFCQDLLAMVTAGIDQG